jgi:hypothetical protein
MGMKCRNCGSEKMIPGVDVQDQGQASDGVLRAHVGYIEPEAIFFPGKVFARWKANICGECGHTEFFANEPAELYAAYLKWQLHNLKAENVSPENS